MKCQWQGGNRCGWAWRVLSTISATKLQLFSLWNITAVHHVVELTSVGGINEAHMQQPYEVILPALLWTLMLTIRSYLLRYVRHHLIELNRKFGACTSSDLDSECGLCDYVIVHTILPPSPVILWILLGGKPKWLPLKCGYHEVMRTAPILYNSTFFPFVRSFKDLLANSLHWCFSHKLWLVLTEWWHHACRWLQAASLPHSQTDCNGR